MSGEIEQLLELAHGIVIAEHEPPVQEPAAVPPKGGGGVSPEASGELGSPGQ
jgi:hypothetical protein